MTALAASKVGVLEVGDGERVYVAVLTGVAGTAVGDGELAAGVRDGAVTTGCVGVTGGKVAGT